MRARASLTRYTSSRGFDGTRGGGVDKAKGRKVQRDGSAVPPGKAEPRAKRFGRFDPVGGLVLLQRLGGTIVQRTARYCEYRAASTVVLLRMHTCSCNANSAKKWHPGLSADAVIAPTLN